MKFMNCLVKLHEVCRSHELHFIKFHEADDVSRREGKKEKKYEVVYYQGFDFIKGSFFISRNGGGSPFHFISWGHEMSINE